MITAVLFTVAAAGGALARAGAGHRFNRFGGMPHGTLAVNLIGSFVLGLLINTDAPALTILGAGGIGAFTTFSGLARDVVSLAERRAWTLAVIYLSASVFGGIAAAALGVALAS